MKTNNILEKIKENTLKGNGKSFLLEEVDNRLKIGHWILPGNIHFGEKQTISAGVCLTPDDGQHYEYNDPAKPVIYGTAKILRKRIRMLYAEYDEGKVKFKFVEYYVRALHGSGWISHIHREPISIIIEENYVL